ncbi:alpha-L-fucosidase [Paraglaciecola sp. L3A3]|uniref:alpha-L-fucosidase n=1 Tax=Paraglaciecola sp. L3A3 TaxID=2686358 RepID=UPI00131D5B30|nr:alpha-L-fucosidase [Paraglaciecola sp. L3A3]
MKKTIRGLFVVKMLAIGAALIISGCSEKQQNKIQQGDDNWIVFDINQSASQQKQTTWQFELNIPAKYDVQIISEILEQESTNSAVPDVNVAIDGIEIAAELKHSFRIMSDNKPLNVFEFQTAHEFKKDGEHSLSVTLDKNVKQVRLVPNYKNPLGSGDFHKEWLTMHESPEKQAALKWFKDARFGMFIHWGLYSGAAGEWKGTRIKKSPIPGPGVAEWLMFKFQISREEYAELAKAFNPDKSFAQNIARLAKDAGMKYVVITSKHHDGFALFDSKVSEFDMVDATPYKADLIKELYDAVLAEGLEFGVYYSHGNDWTDGTDGNYAEVKKTNDKLGVFTSYKGKNLWDPSPNSHSEYLQSKAYPQVAELINLLPKLRVIWFDGDGLITEKQAFDFYKLAYDMNPNILVNRRVGYDFGDYLDAGDNVIPSADDNLEKHWETAGTTNNSWGYNDQDFDWKSTKELLYYFIDITSKGGNYLLNIGPDGKGHVPAESAKGLREMGQWVKTNRDAIFGTTPWTVQREGQDETLLKGTGHRAAKGFVRKFTQNDFWFTARENKVYAMSLVPAVGKVSIKSLNSSAGDIQSVRLLGSEQSLNWQQNANSLEIDFSNVETAENGYGVEVVLK